MADPPLSDAQRSALREAMEAERSFTAGRLAALDRTFDEMVAAADLEPPDDEHDPEGTTAYERAQVSSLAREARSRLADLDRALAGVDDPAFGACQRLRAADRVGAAARPARARPAASAARTRPDARAAQPSAAAGDSRTSGISRSVLRWYPA